MGRNFLTKLNCVFMSQKGETKYKTGHKKDLFVPLALYVSEELQRVAPGSLQKEIYGLIYLLGKQTQRVTNSSRQD